MDKIHPHTKFSKHHFVCLGCSGTQIDRKHLAIPFLILETKTDISEILGIDILTAHMRFSVRRSLQ